MGGEGGGGNPGDRAGDHYIWGETQVSKKVITIYGGKPRCPRRRPLYMGGNPGVQGDHYIWGETQVSKKATTIITLSHTDTAKYNNH
jgi:hypothetical protein